MVKVDAAQKVLFFEYCEQVMTLLSLERAQKLRMLEIGGAVDGDRLDKYEDQAWEEARRQEFAMRGQLAAQKHRVESLQVVPDPTDSDTVQIGTFVTIREDGTCTDETYFIGGGSSAIDNCRVSAYSPLGAVLIGHRVDDLVTVVAPGGSSSFRIRNIQHGVQEYLEQYLTKIAEQVARKYEYLDQSLGIRSLLDPTSARTGSMRKFLHPRGPKEVAEAYALQAQLLDLEDQLTFVLGMARTYDIAVPSIPEIERCSCELSQILKILGIRYPGLFEECHKHMRKGNRAP